MSHHHYVDVIDTSKKENMVHHYDDGPDVKTTNDRIKKIEEEKELLEKEKKELVEAKEIKNKKAHDLSVQLKKLKVVKDKTEKAIIETTLELNKHCTHEKVFTKTHNVRGGYLNKSEHWVYYFCEVCGAKVDEKVEYGSFE